MKLVNTDQLVGDVVEHIAIDTIDLWLGSRAGQIEHSVFGVNTVLPRR